MTGQASTTEHEHCLAPGCGRRLYCAASRSRGYGWGCWRRIRAAAKAKALAAKLAVFTRRQVDQAVELVEDAAIVPAGEDGVFYAVSTDGTEDYRTTAETCLCPAGERGNACYHRCAALLVTT